MLSCAIPSAPRFPAKKTPGRPGGRWDQNPAFGLAVQDPHALLLCTRQGPRQGPGPLQAANSSSRVLSSGPNRYSDIGRRPVTPCLSAPGDTARLQLPPTSTSSRSTSSTPIRDRSRCARSHTINPNEHPPPLSYGRPTAVPTRLPASTSDQPDKTKAARLSIAKNQEID